MTLKDLKSSTKLPQRLEFVGTGVYGSQWMTRLAAAIGVSRSMLFEYRHGRRTDRDLDGRLLDLIERERDAASERGMMLTRLRTSLIAMIGAANKRGDRDAA